MGGGQSGKVGGGVTRGGGGVGGSRTREESGASSGRKAGLGELDAGLALAHRTLAPSMIRLTVMIMIIMIMMALAIIIFTLVVVDKSTRDNSTKSLQETETNEKREQLRFITKVWKITGIMQLS